jgi:transaldolase
MKSPDAPATRRMKCSSSRRLIRDSAVTGATSNPTMFAKAITGSDRYDNRLREAVASGIHDPQELFFELALDDVGRAADLLRAAYDASEAREASSRSNAPIAAPTTRWRRSGKRWSCGGGSRGPT